MVMVRPSRLATVMASISCMLPTRPIVRSVYSVAPTFIEPLGIWRFCDAKRAGHVGHRQLVGAELQRIELDVDLPGLAADDHHLAHAGDRLQLPPQHLVAILGDVADRGRRRGRHGDRQDRASSPGPASRRSAARCPWAGRAARG